MTEYAAIASDLTRLGLSPGSTALVHSSLRSLGFGRRGAELLWRALRSAVGDDGTVLVPTLSYENVNAEQPVFDVRTTPACVGAFAEWVRTQPEVLRSVHPTHSVAGAGPLAAWLLAGHIADRTPAGPNSPFRRLRDVGGSILMLGCGLGPNTSMHGVEELTEPPYLFTHEAEFQCVDAEGASFVSRYRCHGDFPQRYERVQNLLDGDELRNRRVGSADAYLISAPALWRRSQSVLASNPLAFTDSEEDTYD